MRSQRIPQALRLNPEALEMMREAEEPASIEEAVELYASIAEKTGISVSKETICALLEQKEKYGGVEDFDSFEVWTKEDEAMPDCEMSFEIHF